MGMFCMVSMSLIPSAINYLQDQSVPNETNKISSVTLPHLVSEVFSKYVLTIAILIQLHKLKIHIVCNIK